MSNKFQLKRTSVSGRTPNTTVSTNTSFIDAGELAVNLADSKLFSSNGSVAFEVGANLTSLSVTNGAIIVANNSTTALRVTQEGTGNAIVVEDSTNPDSTPFVVSANGWTVIGANTPSNVLQVVVPNAAISQGIEVTTTSTNGYFRLASGSSSGFLPSFSGQSTLSTTAYGMLFTGKSANNTSTVEPNILFSARYNDGTSTGTNLGSNQLAFQFSNFVTPLMTISGNGNIGIGNTTPANRLVVAGTSLISGNAAFSANITVTGTAILNAVSANGTVGTAGQVLTSNGTTTYWATPGASSGKSAGDGLTTNSTHYAVLANSGIVANATGTYVDTTYIGTLSANNASFLGGTSASSYQLNSTLAANVATLTANNTTYLNGQLASFYAANSQLASYALLSGATFSGVVTFNANTTWGAGDHIVLSSTSGISANGTFGTAGQMLTSNGTAVYWSTPQIGDITAVTAGSGITGGGTSGDVTVSVNPGTGIVANATGVHVNSSYIATITANNTSFVGSTAAANVVSNTQLQSNLANYQTTAGLSANVATLTSNNATYFNGHTWAAPAALGSGTANTGAFTTANASVAINVGANVNISTSQLNIGNSTVNTVITSTDITGSSNASLNYVNVASYIDAGVTYSATRKVGIGGVSSNIDNGYYTLFSNTLISNATITAARTYGGVYSLMENNNQNFNAGNIIQSASDGYGISSYVYNGNSSTGGDAYLDFAAGMYADVRNYANGATSNTITRAAALFGQIRTFRAGFNTAHGVYANIAISNTTAGAIGTAYGSRIAVQSNTAGITTSFLYHGQVIGNTTVSNSYGIYMSGEARNYVSGSFGIGNAVPSDTLSVNGTGYFSGNVSIAGTSDLVLLPGAGISANGSLGSAGQVLTVNSTAGAYWSTQVASVTPGNGLTSTGTTGSITVTVGAGNGITTNTTAVAVDAGTGIVSNTTGVHVNSTYIATISSNNASFLGTVAAANYIQNSGAYTISGVHTHSANVVITNTADLVLNAGAGIYANGVIGGAGQVLTSNATGGTYWSTPASGGVTSLTGTANQVLVGGTSGSAQTGALTLTLPQDVNTGSSVRFGSIGCGIAASGTTGEIRATNNITAYSASDKRLKENVTSITDALSKVLKISGVTFDWTDEHIENRGGEDGYFVRKHDVGVIAQEIEEVLSEAVATREDGYKAVRYELIIPLLIEAIKDQQNQINELKELLNGSSS